MENKFLKLTNTVYKLLEFFPDSDPLKIIAKDKALSILEQMSLINETSGWASFQKEKIKSQVLEDIDTLLGYLWIGKSQGWLNSFNCLIVSNEYEKMKGEVRPVMAPIIELTKKLPGIEEPIKEGDSVSFDITGRKAKILEYLKYHEKAQVMDLMTVLPDITKRTIRRDLDELLKLNKIVRSWEFNQVFYKINN